MAMSKKTKDGMKNVVLKFHDVINEQSDLVCVRKKWDLG